MSSVAVRSALLTALDAARVGRFYGFHADAAAGPQDELQILPPSRWYVTGFLAPRSDEKQIARFEGKVIDRRFGLDAQRAEDGKRKGARGGGQGERGRQGGGEEERQGRRSARAPGQGRRARLARLARPARTGRVRA